jgi:K+-transporting ATPase ATPase C chain
MPYNGAGSTGSNQGPLNPALLDAVKARLEALRAADPGNTAPVPVDLVTASASGLDPQISPAAARYQVARVARARHLPAETVAALVDQQVEQPWLPIIGAAGGERAAPEPRPRRAAAGPMNACPKQARGTEERGGSRPPVLG